MDPPAPETLMRALELLNYLGALDDEGNMSKVHSSACHTPPPPLLIDAVCISSCCSIFQDMLTGKHLLLL